MIFVLRADHNATDKRRLSLRASLSLAAGLGLEDGPASARTRSVRLAYVAADFDGSFPRG
jgi:hypothetical protein